MVKIIHTRDVPEIKNEEGLWLGSYYPEPYHCHSTRSFRLWSDLKQRTKMGTKCWIKNKSYQTVVNSFQDYQEFAEFCNTEYGFSLKYKDRFWALDKDILQDFEKGYSKDTCLFVPAYVNNLFTKTASKKTDLPIGVTLQNSGPNPFAAWCKDFGKTRYLGLFNEPMVAHKAWQKARIDIYEKLCLKDELIPHKRLIAGLMDKIEALYYDWSNDIETFKV